MPILASAAKGLLTASLLGTFAIVMLASRTLAARLRSGRIVALLIVRTATVAVGLVRAR